MARKLFSRLKINGTLRADTALHVGGHGISPDTDMPLAINGAGDFYIPGTSIAGVLREWCERNFGHLKTSNNKELVDLLFGYQKEKDGHASFVIVEDIALSKDIQDELRDGVGIDRFFGIAFDKAKFDRAVLPRGTKLKFGITVEIQTEDDSAKIKAVFGHLLEALRKGEIRFGASKTRGLGRVTLTKLRVIKDQKFNEILTWINLNGNDQEFIDEPSIENEINSKLNKSVIEKKSARFLEIKIKWEPKSALMVKAGYEGMGVDMLPLTSGNGKGKVSLCLPGSSIKGAFRSHAERILRTVLDCEEKRDCYLTRGKDLHEQIKLKIVDELFGAKKERENGDVSEKEKDRQKYLGLGALSIDDCYAEKSFSADIWRKIESGKMKDDETYKDQELWQELRKLDLEKKSNESLTEEEKAEDTKAFKISHHVAIDRWTGGASEGALYSILQPAAKIGWPNIVLTLDFSRFRQADGSLDESLQKRALVLLLFILRDFAENRLPLGFATNRGMGEVEEVSFTASGFYDFEWKNGGFDFKDLSLKTDLEAEWDEWLKIN